MTAQSFLAGVRSGRADFDLLADFPEPSAAERDRLAAVVEPLHKLLDDPELARRIDRTGELPPELVEELSRLGLMTMLLEPRDGGLGLSVHNGFRVVEAAAGHSAAVGMFLAIHNALGVGAFLPTMEERPLRDFIADRLAGGSIAGMASTEKGGAANHRRSTVAVPTPDGSGYLLNGEKLYISNGAVAGILSVTATVLENAGDTDGPVGIFVFDTSWPGFSVLHRQRFMGLGGSPNAVIRFDDMVVPKEYLLADPRGAWRMTPPYLGITTVARSYITAAVSSGVAAQCAGWARDFVLRRRMDDRSLADYDAVRRLVATVAAEVFAMDGLIRWSTVPGDSVARQAEFDALKNLLTMGSWRVADGTLSLFGGEGYETADSKAARGADPVPVEQAVRDLRGLRVAGGIDFNIDRQLGENMFRLLADTGGGGRPAPDVRDSRLWAALGERNRAHLAARAGDAARLADRCRALIRAHDDLPSLFEHQQVVISANRIADEILACGVCLARAAGEPGTADLADVYCTAAEARIAGYWHDLEAAARPDQPAYATVAFG